MLEFPRETPLGNQLNALVDAHLSREQEALRQKEKEARRWETAESENGRERARGLITGLPQQLRSAAEKGECSLEVYRRCVETSEGFDRFSRKHHEGLFAELERFCQRQNLVIREFYQSFPGYRPVHVYAVRIYWGQKGEEERDKPKTSIINGW